MEEEMDKGFHRTLLRGSEIVVAWCRYCWLRNVDMVVYVVLITFVSAIVWFSRIVYERCEK